MAHDIKKQIERSILNSIKEWGGKTKRHKNRLEFLRSNGVKTDTLQDLYRWLNDNCGGVVMNLWSFPDEDFAEWLRTCADPDELAQLGGKFTLAAYKLNAAGVIAYLERKGFTVNKIMIPVSEMLAELRRRGWENIPKNRAAIADEFSVKK